jgi:hypothetical protein
VIGYGVTLVLEIDFLSYSVEVSSRITGELGGEIDQLSRNTIKGGIGEVLGKNTSPRPEHQYQPTANRFVFPAGSFRIRAQPIQESFEGSGIEKAVGADLAAP